MVARINEKLFLLDRHPPKEQMTNGHPRTIRRFLNRGRKPPPFPSEDSLGGRKPNEELAILAVTGSLPRGRKQF